MKALPTIMALCKPYEFRGWAAPRAFRGRRIGIHAGARPVRKSEIADLLLRLRSDEAWSTALHREPAIALLERVSLSPGVLPLASMLGSALLGEPKRSNLITAEFGGPVNDSDRGEHSNWAWPLTEIERFEPPRPARGAQGFWNWEDTL